MNAHDEMLESVAVLALGALPDEEARSIGEHVRSCPECRAEYAALRGAANALGYAAELASDRLDGTTAARMKAAVMNGIRAGTNGNANGTFARPDFAFPARSRATSTRSWVSYAAIAASVALAISTWANVESTRSLRSENDRALQQVAALSAKSAELQGRLAALTAPDSKHYAVPAGEVVTSEGHVFLALKMNGLAPGKVYQAWVLRRGARTVAPSVTFVAESGVTLVELPESARGVAAVAVSVEPAGGSKAPTSKPAFVRSLS